jgi:hypothetical protein
MLKNRLFNVLIAFALVVTVALTVREAFATSSITSQNDIAIKCDSLPSRYSIHTEIMETTGTRLTYTEDGPTGIDGGLMHLLSAYRTCSR